MEMLDGLLFAAIFSAAGLWDWAFFKIPNRLLQAALWAGLMCAGRQGWEAGGMAGAALALGLFGARALLALGSGFILYLFRVVGAGDVKLAAVILGALGFWPGGAGIGLGFVLAAAWAAGRMAAKGIFWERMAVLGGYGRRLFMERRVKAYYEAGRDGREAVIPLGSCMVLGVGIWSFLGI